MSDFGIVQVMSTFHGNYHSSYIFRRDDEHAGTAFTRPARGYRKKVSDSLRARTENYFLLQRTPSFVISINTPASVSSARIALSIYVKSRAVRAAFIWLILDSISESDKLARLQCLTEGIRDVLVFPAFRLRPLKNPLHLGVRSSSSRYANISSNFFNAASKAAASSFLSTPLSSPGIGLAHHPFEDSRSLSLSGV